MITTVLIALLTLTGPTQSGAAPTDPQIVFVCEHGAAKSLVATAYFNKLADVVTFLASPRTNYMTGTVIPVDGGIKRYAH